MTTNLKLKLSTLVLALSLVSLTSCNKDNVKGKGDRVDRTYPVSDFTRIEASGTYKLNITQGPNYEVKLRDHQNLLDVMEVRVKDNDKLSIGLKNGVNVQNSDLEVFITLPNLREIDLSGSSTTIIRGNFSGDKLYINASGKQDISIIDNLIYDKTEMNFSGNVKSTGYGFTSTSNGDLILSGDCEAELTSYGKLDGQLSGNSIVRYKGTPSSINVSLSGTSSITKQ